MLDTGKNAQESFETLRAQQAQLIAGRRPAQMFPRGTVELPLPDGFERHENDRGVFHFKYLTPSLINRLSAEGCENEILLLGPFSKPDIEYRLLLGERVNAITEYTADGHELRSAACTETTMPEQMAYFERTREPGGRIEIGKPPRITIVMGE